jgi:hypothetical protein
MSLRRNGIRLTALVVLLLGMWASTAAQASAAPAIPGVPDCKDAPAAQRPGDGLTGFLDAPPTSTPPVGDPFATHPTTSVYEQYGYAGLGWHTYDLGCGGDVRDVGAATDTMIGNATLSLASWGVAATNGLHNRIAHPGEYMAPLDDVVTAVSARIKDAIWSPWGGAALLGVVMLLLWYSASGRIAAVTKAAGWAVLVLAVMAGVAQYPSRVSSFFDQTVTGTISQVNASTAGLAELPPTADPAKAQGALLVDRLLYDSWLRGELGSVDSATARKWGPALFRASAYTWAEARQADDPARARQLQDRKATAWKDVAARIQDQDPSAYQALQGRSGNRTGVGIMAVCAVGFTSLFRVVADLFMFAGLVLLRFLVMLFPAVAVLGVLSPMSSIVRRVANMAGASVVNVVAFAAGAAVHTTVISALLSRAQQGGMNLLVLVLCLVSTIAAFVLLFPLLSLTNVIGLSAGGRGVHALRRAGRLATRYGVTRKAVGDGEHDAGSEAGEAGFLGGGEAAGARSASGASKGYRAIQLPAEGFGRPETQVGAAGPGGALAGARRPAASLPSTPARTGTSTEDLSPSTARPSGWGRGAAPPAEALRDTRPAQQPARMAFPARPEALVGVVVEPGRRGSGARPVHDSETVVRPDGIGPRLYDPATRSSSLVDTDGNVVADGRPSP